MCDCCGKGPAGKEGHQHPHGHCQAKPHEHPGGGMKASGPVFTILEPAASPKEQKGS